MNTPGIWYLNHNVICSAMDGTEEIVGVAVPRGPGNADEQLANARLMASAKELLRILKEIRKELDANTGYWTEHLDTLSLATDALVAKVEGRIL